MRAPAALLLLAAAAGCRPAPEVPSMTTPAPAPAAPALDRAVAAKLETATFALG